MTDARFRSVSIDRVRGLSVTLTNFNDCTDPSRPRSEARLGRLLRRISLGRFFSLLFGATFVFDNDYVLAGVNHLITADICYQPLSGLIGQFVMG